MWSTLVTEKNNPRSEILINIDEIANYAAIRRGDFKYVIGSTKNGDLWYGETGRVEEQEIEGCLPTYNPQEILMSKAGVAISGAITTKQIQQMRIVRENESSPSFKSKIKILLQSEITKLRSDAEVICTVKKEDEVSIPFSLPMTIFSKPSNNIIFTNRSLAIQSKHHASSTSRKIPAKE